MIPRIAYGVTFILLGPLQKLHQALAPFTSLFPLSLEQSVAERTSFLTQSFQQLERIDSLSEQIGFLEERLETCEHPSVSPTSPVLLQDCRGFYYCLTFLLYFLSFYHSFNNFLFFTFHEHLYTSCTDDSIHPRSILSYYIHGSRRLYLTTAGVQSVPH